MNVFQVLSSLKFFRQLATLSSCHLVILIAVFIQSGKAVAQAPYVETTYTQEKQFRIPFKVDPAERRIQQVQLFMSADQGRTWSKQADTPPEQGSFYFTAQRDGLYWFSVRTIDVSGTAFPMTMEGAQPGLKVS